MPETSTQGNSVNTDFNEAPKHLTEYISSWKQQNESQRWRNATRPGNGEAGPGHQPGTARATASSVPHRRAVSNTAVGPLPNNPRWEAPPLATRVGRPPPSDGLRYGCRRPLSRGVWGREKSNAQLSHCPPHQVSPSQVLSPTSSQKAQCPAAGLA